VPAKLTTDLGRWADLVVTMGCGDACPVIPGKRYIDWKLADPKGLPLEKVREIRCDIETRVLDLVHSLDGLRQRGQVGPS
jgi:protein-tyrosine-phosphatase